MTQKKIKRGLFFDLDGTLANSKGILQMVYESFLTHFDRIPSQSEFDLLNGPPLTEAISYLKETHGITENISELLSFYQVLIKENYSNVKPSAGAYSLLACTHKRGWINAIVTSNNQDLTTYWLNKTGLSKWISFVIAAENVKNGKPSPEPYLKALHQAQVSANFSIGIEDTPAGAHSSSSAGLQTIVLHTPPTNKSEWPPGCTFVSNLNELNHHI